MYCTCVKKTAELSAGFNIDTQVLRINSQFSIFNLLVECVGACHVFLQLLVADMEIGQIASQILVIS